MRKKILNPLLQLDHIIEEHSFTESLESSDAIVDMFQIMEDEQDLMDKTSDLSFVDGLLNEAEASIERLSSIRDTLQKYGISQTMMHLADPEAELVSAGICGSYENLSDIPMKDTDSCDAIEGLGATIESITSRIGDFFNVAGAKLLGWGESVKRLFVSYETTLIAQLKQLNRKSTNEERFAELSATAFTKSEFDDALRITEHVLRLVSGNSLNKVANDLERVMNGTMLEREYVAASSKKAGERVSSLIGNADIDKFVGLQISLTDDGAIHSVQSVRPSVFPKRAKTADLNWASDDVLLVVRKSLNMLTAARLLDKNIDMIVSSCKNMSDTLKAQSVKTKDFARDTKTAYSLAVADTKTIIMANRQILKVTVQSINRIVASSISLANAALKAAS